MNKRLFHMFSLLALTIVLTAGMLPVNALAQYGRYRYQNDRYDRYQPNRRYSKSYVNNIIRRVESSSNRFQREVDRYLDYSRLNGTRREDNINEDVRQFAAALDGLRREFDRRDNWWETRQQVEAALVPAREVAVRFRNNRFDYRLQSQWRNLERDLNQLARTYDIALIR